MKKKNWNYIIKGVITLFYFAAVLFIAFKLKLPEKFDSHTYLDDDFEVTSVIYLILYRAAIYLFLPPLISLFEKAVWKKPFRRQIFENYNVQFCTYGLIAGIYYLCGADKLLNVDIFSSSDAFLFLTGFILTSILAKKIPIVVQGGNEQ